MFKLSAYANRFQKNSGILELMQDLDVALNSPGDWLMLGGGNPASIPELDEIFDLELQKILAHDRVWQQAQSNYAGPIGDREFRKSLADYLNQRYGFEFTPAHIALTNGSQDAFLKLFNLFCGRSPAGIMKSLVLPRLPDYIGYMDLVFDQSALIGVPGLMLATGTDYFSYAIDYEALKNIQTPGALCLSRPTNPTGQVVSVQELNKLYDICRGHEIPLILDGAYGAPFPNLQFTDAEIFWKPGVIWVLSLSKLGLPGLRCGIVIADPEVTRLIQNMNAILCLAPGNIGPMMGRQLLVDKKVDFISENILRPYYNERRQYVLNYLKEARVPGMKIHDAEGAFFCWIYLQNLSISIREFYARLKERSLLIVPGDYFYPGAAFLPEEAQRSLRLSFTRDLDTLQRGLKILVEEALRYNTQFL